MFGLINTFPILAVDNKHEALGAGVVMSPEGADLVLATNVPDVELDVLVCHGLHVEANYVHVKYKREWGKKGMTPVGIVVTDWFNLSL